MVDLKTLQHVTVLTIRACAIIALVSGCIWLSIRGHMPDEYHHKVCRVIELPVTKGP